MNDEIQAIIVDGSRNIIYAMDDELFGIFACVEKYVNRFCFEFNSFQNVDSREVRSIVNRYFKDVVDNIEYNLKNFLYKTIEEVQSYRNTPDYDYVVKKRLSEDNIVNFMNEKLGYEMKKGLNAFDYDFLFDFKDSLSYRTINPDFNLGGELNYFRNNLGTELESLLADYQRTIVKVSKVQMEKIRDSYEQVIRKEENEKQQNNSEENTFDNIIKECMKRLEVIKNRYPEKNLEVLSIELMLKGANSLDEFDAVLKRIEKLEETINMKIHSDNAQNNKINDWDEAPLQVDVKNSLQDGVEQSLKTSTMGGNDVQAYDDEVDAILKETEEAKKEQERQRMLATTGMTPEQLKQLEQMDLELLGLTGESQEITNGKIR